MNTKIPLLKNKIKDCEIKGRELQLQYCEELLDIALKENNHEAISYAYLWMADYFYYVENDTKKLSDYLYKTKLYLSDKASDEKIKYYTLKPLDDKYTYDILGRLDDYLQIIKTAEELGRESDVAHAFGNIADLMRLCHDYEGALKYSLNVLEGGQLSFNSSKIILLANIVELLYYLDRPQNMLEYINIMVETQWNSSLFEVFELCCYLRYYSSINDSQKTIETYESMFTKLKNLSTNRAFLYDFLIIMLEAVYKVKNVQSMHDLLVYMESMFHEDDANQWLHIQKMKIKYFDLAHEEKRLREQYRSYIKTYERVEQGNQAMKINGIRALLEVIDITSVEDKIREDNQILENDSMLDTMTQLYNRRYFNKILSENENNHSNYLLGFAIFDVDYFKEYNDMYGHLMGDQALILVATILKKHAKDTIYACRFGGDEFICVFVDVSPQEIAQYVHNVVNDLKLAAMPHLGSHCSDVLTLSIGYGYGEMNEHKRSSTLLKHVDEALYSSKQKGRNICTCFNEQEASI